MFLDFELAAGVRHVHGRGFHGFRRRAVDVMVKHGATPSQIQAAGNWSSVQIPYEVALPRYRDPSYWADA